MTEATDINLLPLPEGESSSFGDYEVHTNETMTDYARACVEANTAPLQAEIERLQAGVDFLGSVIATHAADTREYQKRISQAEARAERMAEALALLPDDIGMIEHSPEEGPFMFCCGREVTYDRLHGPVCTHDEDCWYAQMRVLLDHGH